LKADSELAGIFIILLSGTKISAEDQSKGLMEGRADGYIIHPVSPKVLLAWVEAFLRLRATQQALRENERKYRELVENANSIILRWNPAGEITFLNEFGQNFFGYREHEIHGRNVIGTIVPETESTGRDLRPLMQRVCENPAAFEQNINENMLRDGRRVWIAWTNKTVFDAEGHLIEVLSIGTDITERKRTEAALNAKHRLLENIINSSADYIFVKDQQLRTLLCNETFARALGKKPAEVAGKTDIENGWDPEFVKGNPAKGIRGYEQDDLEALSGKTVHIVSESGNVSGAVRVFDTIKLPLYNEAGEIIGLLGLSRDITERQQAEEAMARTAREWQTTFDATNDAIWILDANHRVLRSNKTAERYFHRPCCEMLGQNCWAIAHGTTEPHPNCPFVRARQSGHREIMELQDGERWLEVTVDPMLDANGHYVGAVHIVSDITERKQSERRELKRRETVERLAKGTALAGNLESIIAFVEGECPQAICSILLLDESRQRLLHGAAPRLPDFYNQAIHGLVIGPGVGSCGTAAFTGQRVIVEDVATHPYWKPFCDLTRQAGVRACWSEPIRSSAGEVLGTFAVYHAQPQLPAAAELETIGAAVHLASIAIERQRAETEKAKLEGQLHQAQKMESVGRLAGGVAHDFNNMLQAILGNVSLALLENLPADSIVRESLQEIQKCALRSADLTRQLLAFARRQTIAPKVLDLNATVESLLKMLHRLIGEDIQLAWLAGASLWPVKVDPTQVDQILANLCVNARDAIGGVGKVTIETENAVFDEAYCADHMGFLPGEYVRLAVSDSGRGMDKETLVHIFEPFFTTKGVGEGTGLGLATVYGIVKQNHGFINVYSEPGKGTTFMIYLPRHATPAAVTRTEAAAELPQSSGETVLLVEDEPTILIITRKLLERLGYTVMIASTPGEAIRMAGASAGEIHLLMTDVVMPEMNGRELARQLLVTHPKLKCLYMSGYTADVIARHGVLDEGVHFIQKPFSMEDLATKIRLALDLEKNGGPVT
jgi:PAS domain S-box-containing protein